jgi:hypothetical protein
MRKLLLSVVLAGCAAAWLQAQGPSAATGGTYDQVLDTYVRDGYVYYRALKLERSRFDGYIASLASVSIDSAPRNEQLAFWINAYNAFVLRTVIDHYPIAMRTNEYPPHSIRQIPGAFERLPHRAAGRTVTLDQIEQAILSGFADPRVYFALGRGAIDGGRLRSEAYVAARIDTQLADIAAECASRPQCVQLDAAANTLNISPVFSWHEKAFVAAYAARAPAAFASRSPLERAVLDFIEPRLLTTERDVLAKNTFQVAFKPFDWSLNDLTGRGGR